MRVFEKTARLAAISIAGLFIVAGVFGIFAVWTAKHKAAGAAQHGFGLIATSADAVDAGVARVESLISASRTEVREASEMIATAGVRAETDTPVLSALGDRLETRLAPRLAQMQQALAPVRDAVGTIGTAVSLMNSLPTIAERAPGLATLDAALTRLQEISVDAARLRDTVRELTAAKKSRLPGEAAATVTGLTQHIDTRLGEVQTSIRGVQEDLAALQERLDQRQDRLLFVFNLLALLATLLLLWMLYAQFIVIRHHRVQLRQPAGDGATTGPRS